MAKSLNALLLGTILFTGASSPAASAQPRALSETEALDRLEQDLDRAESIEAVKRLTYMFGYYRDALHYDRALALFDDNATFDFANGQYVGKRSIRRLFHSKRFNAGHRAPGSDGPAILNNHVMMQPVITLGPDGRTARGRFKEFGFEGEQGKSQTYIISMYENDYVRDAAHGWRIKAVRHCFRFNAPYDMAAKDLPEPPPYSPLPAFFPKDAEGPDRQISYHCHVYPDVGINPPFHFTHPVTGENISKP